LSILSRFQISNVKVKNCLFSQRFKAKVKNRQFGKMSKIINCKFSQIVKSQMSKTENC